MQKILQQKKEQRRIDRQAVKAEERFKKDLQQELERSLYKAFYVCWLLWAMLGSTILGMPLGFSIMPVLGIIPMVIPKYVVESEKCVELLKQKAIKNSATTN